MRFAELQRDELSGLQREVYDHIARGPRQGVDGPFIAWLRAPEFADHAEAMGDYLRFESSLSQDIRELAVLMVARTWQAAFVWNAHRPLAVAAGLSNDVLTALSHRVTPSFTNERQAAAYHFLNELMEVRRVSDLTWGKAIDSFSEQGVVDLIGTAGYYTMVSLTIVATELGTELQNPFTP